MRHLRKWSVARAAAVGAALLVFCGAGHAQTPLFQAYAFVGVNNSSVSEPNFFAIEDFGNSYFESPIPVNTFVNFSKTYPGPQGDTQFSALAAANYRGFWSAGTHAEGSVTNAYAGSDNASGFYVIGGMGSWTRHRFVSPESLSGPFSRFHWRVSGTSSYNAGIAQSRLDFAVTPVTAGVTGFNDFYNTSIVPNRLTEFGPGSYTYHTAIALDTPLDFLFWSSAYWQVNRGEVPATPGNLFGLAEFMSTFELESVELFNGDGTLVSTWGLVDEATGQEVFNQNGRVVAQAEVPDAGTGALMGAGLLPLAGMIARRRRPRAA